MSTYYSRAGGYSRSFNAEVAESRGRFPLTRAIEHVCEQAVCPPSVARRVLLAIGTSEWHHVGKHASRVDYYETERAIRIARRVTKPAERARILRTWTRAAFAAAEIERTEREVAAGHRATNERARRDFEDARFAREIEARADAAVIDLEREIHRTNLLANYRRNPTPGRLQALRAMGIEPEAI